LKVQRGELLMKQHEEIEEIKCRRESELESGEDSAQTAQKYSKTISAANQKHKIETKLFDKRIYTDLIQKVCDQQDALQRAGICGFQITEDISEIKFQMSLIQALQKFDKTRNEH